MRGLLKKYGGGLAVFLTGGAIAIGSGAITKACIEKHNNLRNEYIKKHVEWFLESCENRKCDSDYVMERTEKLIDHAYSEPISYIKDNLEKPYCHTIW
jgi:hypothetical protein